MDPSTRIQNMEMLDQALARLKLYRTVFLLFSVAQAFSICDSWLQLASTCFGSSVDINYLTGHPPRFTDPPNFKGPAWLRKVLFQLNFFSLKNGAKFIDLTWDHRRNSEEEFMYNVRLKSVLSVITGRLLMWDSYISPVVIMASLQITRRFFRSLFSKSS